MVRIGEDRSERLDIVPAQLRVIVTVRPKYACRSCAQGVTQALAPARLIEGGLPTEGAIAHVLVSKYAEHWPPYRQVQIYARFGLDLDRSTLAGWVGKLSFHLWPVTDRGLAPKTVLEAVHGRDAGTDARSQSRPDEDRLAMGAGQGRPRLGRARSAGRGVLLRSRSCRRVRPWREWSFDELCGPALVWHFGRSRHRHHKRDQMLGAETILDRLFECVEGVFNSLVSREHGRNFIQRCEDGSLARSVSTCQLPSVAHQPAKHVSLHFQMVPSTTVPMRQECPESRTRCGAQEGHESSYCFGRNDAPRHLKFSYLGAAQRPSRATRYIVW